MIVRTLISDNCLTDSVSRQSSRRTNIKFIKFRFLKIRSYLEIKIWSLNFGIYSDFCSAIMSKRPVGV